MAPFVVRSRAVLSRWAPCYISSHGRRCRPLVFDRKTVEPRRSGWKAREDVSSFDDMSGCDPREGVQ
jgi:hypothetical protein